MQRVLLFLLILSSQSLFSQRAIDVDKYDGNALAFFNNVGGDPVIRAKFTRLVEGSPYFENNWMLGSVVIEDKHYEKILMRVNIFDRTLEFRDNNGQEMTCNMPIRQVVLTDSIQKLRYIFQSSNFLPANPDLKPNTWLQLLADGKTAVYKFHKKHLTEIRPYGSATYEQRISTTNVYYLLLNDQWVRVKKFSEIPSILSARKDQLTKFIQANSLNGKDDYHFARLISYYNTL